MHKPIARHAKLAGLFFLVGLFNLPFGLSQGNFVFSPGIEEVYKEIMDLRWQKAESALKILEKKEPNNLLVLYLYNYLDFFQLFIEENKAEFKLRKKNRDFRLDRIKNGEASSPYNLYIQADIRLQWALLKLKFEEYIGAFSDISAAHRLLKSNLEKFPEFHLTYKNLGILHSLVGTVPDNYKWGVKLLSGLEGDVDQGTLELKKSMDYADEYCPLLYSETVVIYTYQLLHLQNRPEAAWSFIFDQKVLNPAKSPLHCFVMANIAMRSDRNDDAIDILTGLVKNKEQHPFPYLEFMLGQAKLRKLDTQAAQHYRHYLRDFKGRNFIKEAYQKLAWSEILNGNPEGYQRYMKLCLEQGYKMAGNDKNAMKEAERATIPNSSLLKARLLFDGGYYMQAKRILEKTGISTFSTKEHQLEYTYRMGRILDGLKELEAGINFYEQTIEMGENEPYFYACNAALQLGLLYEKKKNKDLAAKYFKKCLSIKPEEYGVTLHQKAKAGLMRIRR